MQKGPILWIDAPAACPERPKPVGRVTRVKHADALRGASQLAIGATKGITQLAQDLHRTIASGPALLGSPLQGPASLLTQAIYGTIVGATDAVGSSIELAVSQLAPLLGESTPSPQQRGVVAALNGVLGDYLEHSQNPLAIKMALCTRGAPLALSPRELTTALGKPSPKLLVLLHGSCMHELQWTRHGHDHGLALARDQGYTPVYLRYNSGLHISTNGAEFAEQMESLVAAWPGPIDEIALLGHSMGGLVARSACHSGERKRHHWRTLVRKLACLGSPHHGAPLERAGNWVETLLGVTPYTAPFVRLGQIRSAGVTDLRFGNVLDEHWEGKDRFALAQDQRTKLSLPKGVACYAIAASKSAKPSEAPLGDGMVSVESALGRHRDPERTLGFPDANQTVVYGANHLGLLDHREVYASLSRG